jgi:NADH-quinone oxidoreductase subunit C
MYLEVLAYLSLNYCKYLKKNVLETTMTNFSCYINIDLLEEFMELVSYDTKIELNQLLDLFAVDYPYKKKRFEVNYVFLSIKNIFRIIFKLVLLKDQSVTSIVKFYQSSNWLEREVWDMFGIFFYNHPDLRRILTDYGFEGYPLRKDFPITGFKEIRYDDERKKIVLEPIRMTQEFRYFDFATPWN